MEDVYDALVVVDYPDAVTGGLRRSADAFERYWSGPAATSPRPFCKCDFKPPSNDEPGRSRQALR